MKYEIDVVEENGRKAFACAALGQTVLFPEIAGYNEFETGSVEIFRDGQSIAKSTSIAPYGTMGAMTTFYIRLHDVFERASCQPPNTLCAKDFIPGDRIVINAPLLPESDDGKGRFFETYLKRHQPA